MTCKDAKLLLKTVALKLGGAGTKIFGYVSYCPTYGYKLKTQDFLQ